MRLLKQSSTAQPLVFLMVSSSDHVTGITGATVTVKLGKSGGTGAAASGAISEIDSTNLPGWYKVAGNATDTGTLGPLVLHASATGADPTDVYFDVVAFDPQATSLGLSLAKTTNITGFNDIAATAIVSSGAITTSSGAVSTVLTLTNAPGDTIGTTTLLGRLTSTRSGYLDNLSAGAVAQASTALSTAVWTAPPTGFLAATFPTTIASPTNITAGTITTAINVTNAPTSGDLTATMKASISGLTIARVTLADTVTTYTGNTKQTGDSFALIGATGSGLTSLAPASTALSTATWTNTVAGRIDASVSSRMATYTQPTGFLAASFPSDPASASTVSGQFAALTEHGDENWEGGGSALDGPSSVTLTFEDASNAAVPLVAFTIVGQGVARAGTNGVAAFGLDDGAYTVLAAPTAGLVFANTALTVSGTTTLTIHGTAVIIPDAPSANQTSAFLYTLDGGGTLQGSQRIEFQFQVPASGDKGSYYAGSFFAISDATTAQLVVSLEKSSGYQARRGAGAWVTFTTGTGSTYELPSILGAP